MKLVLDTVTVMMLLAFISSVAAVKSVYQRWGRTDCGPSDTQLVYEGIMAGPNMGGTGGGTDYMCMALDPTPTSFIPSYAESAWLGGTEIYSHTSTNGENLKCAVCAPKYRSAVMVIPGKNVCPDGWVTEYTGFLAASKYTSANPTSFLCLDDQPEFVDGASAEDSGSKITYTKTDCHKYGSLHHCGNGKYNHSSAVLCAVCSQ